MGTNPGYFVERNKTFSMSRTTLRNLEVWICGNLQIKSKNRATFDKKRIFETSLETSLETPLVTWLNIVTVVVRSVRLLACTCAKTSTPLISCIANDGLIKLINILPICRPNHTTSSKSRSDRLLQLTRLVGGANLDQKVKGQGDYSAHKSSIISRWA